jgi:transposase-like protein
MPPRIPDDKRQAIADAVRAGGTQRGIARDFGVSGGTVQNIVAEYGIENAFDRTATARASAAKRIDNAAKRAQLSESNLDDAMRVRERIWQPADQVVPSGQIVTLDLPSARDVRDFAAAVQALAKTHIELDKHDSAQGHDDQKSMLAGIAEGLRAFQRAKDQG